MESLSLGINQRAIYFVLVLASTLSSCQKHESTPTTPVRAIYQEANCEKPVGISGIIGGKKVIRESWPSRHTVLISSRQKGGGQAICTGTLLTSRIVLTAAHCVDDRIQTEVHQVYFSEFPSCDHSLSQLEVKKSTVLQIHLHPEWKQKQQDRPRVDLALIDLSIDAPAPYIPVQLVPSNFSITSQSRILGVGYGNTKAYGDPDGYSEIALRETWIPLVSEGFVEKLAKTKRLDQTKQTEIAEAYRNFDQSHFILVDQTEGQGICSGDSGGPAFATFGADLIQVGVARFVVDPIDGVTKNSCQGVGGYTALRPHLDWIETTKQFIESSR